MRGVFGCELLRTPRADRMRRGRSHRARRRRAKKPGLPLPYPAQVLRPPRNNRPQQIATNGRHLRTGQESSRVAAQARQGAGGRPGRAFPRPRPLRRDRRRQPLLVVAAPFVAVAAEATRSPRRCSFDRAGARRRRDGQVASPRARRPGRWPRCRSALAMMLIAVAASVAMGGWTWTAKPLGPKLQQPSIRSPASAGVFSKAAADRRAEGEPAGAAARRASARSGCRAMSTRFSGVLGACAAGGDPRAPPARWRAACSDPAGAWRCSPRSTCRCSATCSRAAEDEPARS